MRTPTFPLIPFSEIDDDARQIAVAWVEQYGTMGFDLENKHKLASDIMNYHRLKLKQDEDWLMDNKDKIPTIEYSEEVYKFIIATAHRIDDCYNVNGIWQRIIKK